MAIDIFTVEPHKVSRDLKGYSLLIYGDPKTGKTTTASRFPNSILLAFEKGYSALPGVLAQPLDTWAEFLKVVKQLDTDEAKEKFDNVIIDTADLAYDASEAHVCALHGVDAIGDVGYGKGYQEAGKNFDTALRKISKMGYGVILISHSQDRTITDENGKEFNRITPTLGNTPRKIVNRFVDIMGYARIVQTPEAGEKTFLYLRSTVRFEAGTRFKYTPAYIEFTYDHLVDAIAEAIDKQAQQDGDSVVDYRTNIPIVEEKDWDSAIAEFGKLTEELVTKNVDKKKIKYVIEQHIGKGRTIAELDPSDLNTDIVLMVLDDLKDLNK